MTGPARMMLAFVPLATYFFVLGLWQSGSRPRVVPGPRDFGLLAFGLGGIMAFGPVGQILVSTLFPRPNLPAWLAVASFVGLLAMALATRARKRLVVYNVGLPELESAVSHAMAIVASSALRTLRGFEDVQEGRGIAIEASPRLHIGVVEAYGDRADALIDAIRPIVRERLGSVERPRSSVATFWFVLSSAAAMIPLLTLLGNTHVIRAAVRKLGGG